MKAITYIVLLPFAVAILLLIILMLGTSESRTELERIFKLESKKQRMR